MARLVFENVSVRYPIYNARAQSLRHQFMRIATGGRIAAEAGHTVSVTALDEVSFELNSGDSIGLIGHNGAGKSTLLRTMAGIYTQDSGRIIREGRIATVLEIGSGMDPELSGYENILRMGMLMGMSLKEARSKIPEIEEFTELGDFLNLPVRTYSSGMTMRLMFAVGTSFQPEILLVDEMFGTGDAGFQEKAKARMHDLIANAEIFVFASHDHVMLGNLCSSVYELKHGKMTHLPDFHTKTLEQSEQ
ncbi:MAG: sugar ABC transporter ATP-binding protein [Halothiobacillus sp. 20-53-49]|nr:MAG: sugar ABC transporter ATP-binding protein [Halothiobacillus sp. 20-53-49]HQT42824.1 ABC transporter ATP-binding protein [Halothiobacillus sp.]